jgi:hypothetical protein
MKRLVVTSSVVVMVAFASVGGVAAQDRPDGGLNREQGITEASTHTAGPDAFQKITFTDIVGTGRPGSGGGD